ncbi:MAG: polysaccharide deacetylase family sporulation protein PdaB [Bacillota bacterium]|nr:polysaccharide deacetylase family sporulation protein PdaB [Bacillota bacterium]
MARKVVLALLAVLAVLLGLAQLPPVRRVMLLARLYPVYQVATTEKVAALTFDISWGTKTPAPVVEILRQKNLRCTFFLSGPWVMNHPDLARLIKAGGHEIASHGHRHLNYSTLSADGVAEQLRLAHQSIKQVLGVEPNLIRTPNGDYNDTVIRTIRANGYEAIQWSTDSLDWLNPGVERIISRVLDRVHPGDIILMHASDSCRQTVAALPAVIDGLRAKGYRLVTVSELLRLAEPAGRRSPLEPGTYTRPEAPASPPDSRPPLERPGTDRR